MLLTHSRARLVKFFLFYIVFTSKIKPNVHKLGLWGPDWKLLRVTFGPRTVCCACLHKMNKFTLDAIWLILKSYQNLVKWNLVPLKYISAQTFPKRPIWGMFPFRSCFPIQYCLSDSWKIMCRTYAVIQIKMQLSSLTNWIYKKKSKIRGGTNNLIDLRINITRN